MFAGTGIRSESETEAVAGALKAETTTATPPPIQQKEDYGKGDFLPEGSSGGYCTVERLQQNAHRKEGEQI